MERHQHILALAASVTCGEAVPLLMGPAVALQRQEGVWVGRLAGRQQSGMERTWLLAPGRPALSPTGSVCPDQQSSKSDDTNQMELSGGLELGEMKDINPLTYTEHSTIVRCNCKRTSPYSLFPELPPHAY